MANFVKIKFLYPLKKLFKKAQVQVLALQCTIDW